jgi:hypothetical protein
MEEAISVCADTGASLSAKWDDGYWDGERTASSSNPILTLPTNL